MKSLAKLQFSKVILTNFFKNYLTRADVGPKTFVMYLQKIQNYLGVNILEFSNVLSVVVYCFTLQKCGVKRRLFLLKL